MNIAFYRNLGKMFGQDEDYPLYDSAIHQAASSGDVTILSNLLAGPGKLQLVDLKNYLGCTPLRLAASKGHANCVKLLLTCGACVDEVDRKGQTALFMSIAGNHVDCVKLLLKAGSDPNGRSENICTPLYVAAWAGLEHCIKLLLDAGAHINKRHTDVEWLTYVTYPLCVSVNNDHIGCFKCLLKAGADITCGQRKSGAMTVMMSALRKKNPTFLQLLLDFGLPLGPEDLLGQQFQLARRDFSAGFLDFLHFKLSNPWSLQSLCRLKIRKLLVPARIQNLLLLPLPTKLLLYLNFD